MNRGPAQNSRPTVSFADKAAAIWGNQTPDWIAELVRFADAEGLAGAERRVGYSRSAISSIIAGKYKGDIDRVEQMVRGALMAETVECPVLGPLGRNACLDWQAKPFAPTSSHRMTMHRACKTCPQRRK